MVNTRRVYAKDCICLVTNLSWAWSVFTGHYSGLHWLQPIYKLAFNKEAHSSLMLQPAMLSTELEQYTEVTL